jgi:hypothetical protein
MRKIVLLALIMGALSITTFAQREKGEMVAGLNIGYSLTGGLINAVGDNDFSGDSIGVGSVNVNAIPAISGTFDYGVGEKFSIGALVSFQSFSGEVNNYTYTDLQGQDRTESVDFGLTRLNFSIVPRFHYGVKSDNVDLYSGLRLGYIHWVGNINTTDENFDLLNSFQGGRPNVGLILFGGRFYFTDEFGANFELAAGAPYIASVGLQYRF